MNIKFYNEQYLNNREEVKNPYVSPLLSPNFKNLPPAHVIIAEFDILHDEGESYVGQLLKGGNTVTHKQYDGMIHSFIVLNKVINKANDAIDNCISLFSEMGRS
jgi:acetyl esterase